jgi:hypothetical protein
MNKILITTGILLMALANAISVNAQDVAGLFTSPGKHFIDAETGTKKRILPLGEVNIHAARDFSKSFKSATDIIWVDGDAGPSVYFKLDGFSMRATYDRLGNREYSLKYYNESGMRKDLRHLVKSTYYDYSILQVTEIERNGNVSYLVKMQNDTEYLTVKVIEGEMYPYEKMTRAKE